MEILQSSPVLFQKMQPPNVCLQAPTLNLNAPNILILSSLIHFFGARQDRTRSSNPGRIISRGGNLVTAPFQVQKCMGGIGRSGRHQYYDSGTSLKVSLASSSLSSPPIQSLAQPRAIASHPSFHSRLSLSGNHKENQGSSTSLLFSSLRRPQKGQIFPSSNRSLSSKSIPYNSILQDGISCQDCAKHYRSSLGMHPRHHRCLFSPTPKLVVSDLLRLRCRSPNLRFPVSSLRPFYSSMGIFQGGKTHKVPPSQSFNYNIFLPGRFLHPSSIPVRSRKSNRYCPSAPSETRIPSKLQKINPHSLTKGSLLRGSFSFRHPSSVSSRRESADNFIPLRVHNSTISQLATSTRKPLRSAKLRLIPSSIRSTSSASTNFLDEYSYVYRDKRSSDSSNRRVQESPTNMEAPELSKISGSNVNPNSISPTNDGRFSKSLVGSSPSSQDKREMECPGQMPFHQLVRAKSNPPISTEVSSPPSEQKC